MPVFFFCIRKWPVSSGLRSELSVFKILKVPYLHVDKFIHCAWFSVKTTQSGRQMTVAGPMPVNLPFWL